MTELTGVLGSPNGRMTTPKEAHSMISVFVGTSVDGFLARPNGTFDFLIPFEGEPHG